jgi:hypothetical protein
MTGQTERAPGADEPRDWIFTFGGDHTALEGVPLRDRFVRFHGTFMDARLQMLGCFGQRWCAQYESEEAAGVTQYGLTEYPVRTEVAS